MASNYLIYGLAKLLYGVRGHDSALIKNTNAFSSNPSPTITVSAPDIGPSESAIPDVYTGHGEDRFPTLTWTAPAGGDPVAEYVILCEDPDPPIPTICAIHGIFYAVPATSTSASPAEVDLPAAKDKSNKTDGAYVTKAGWKFVPNIRGTSYLGPKPPVGHGIHRYFFTVVALKEKLDEGVIAQGGKVNKANFLKALDGKVLGWGEWIGHYETKW